MSLFRWGLDSQSETTTLSCLRIVEKASIEAGPETRVLALVISGVVGVACEARCG